MLAHQHQPGDGGAGAVLQPREIRIGEDAPFRKGGTQQRGGMGFQGEMQMPLILHHLLAQRHGGQRHRRFLRRQGDAGQERQVVLVGDAAQGAHRP